MGDRKFTLCYFLNSDNKLSLLSKLLQVYLDILLFEKAFWENSYLVRKITQAGLRRQSSTRTDRNEII